ncbi:uncharacterized protein LOC120587867 isoform X5 [Pteropus medius]|uniref:uncharacterized protein LOC120587867 isoform X5 n=1 Tax=Pteropus vampyrus TaxID=132908 RepID=UPI00196A3C4E|nr:uncharacterized protein LOC120587867 isoform X5 [Pteropus giganteus]
MSPSCRAPRTRRSGSSRQDGGNGQQRTRGKGRFQMLVSPASLTTWTGWQGIKVLRGLFQHCRDGMNGDQGQNTIHTAAVTEKKMLKSPLKPRFLLCPHLRLSCLSQPDGTIKKWRGFKRERRAHFFLLSISSLVMPTLTTVLSLLKHTSAVVGTLLWLTAEFPRDTRASVWCCFFSQRTGAEGVDRISVRPAGPASMP